VQASSTARGGGAAAGIGASCYAGAVIRQTQVNVTSSSRSRVGLCSWEPAFAGAAVKHEPTMWPALT
jgi:hypothetical protein